MEVDYAPTEAEQAEGEQEQPTAADLTFAPPELSFTEDVFTPLVPPIALGAIAFAVVALMIWAGQRMTRTAANQNGYTQALSREMAPAASDSADSTATVARAAAAAHAPVGFPGAGMMPTRIVMPQRVQIPLPPLDRTLVTGPFLGDENRKAAKAALQPVRDLLELIRKYDTHGLWSSESAASGLPLTPTVNSGGIAPVTLPSPMAVANAAYNHSRGATFQGTGMSSAQPPSASSTIDSVEHIHDRTEALATQVNMTLLPVAYPEPLRADVKAISQEVHIYLKDADIAATADPESYAYLRRQATLRLNHAQRMYEFMNGVVDGTADVNNPPRL